MRATPAADKTWGIHKWVWRALAILNAVFLAGPLFVAAVFFGWSFEPVAYLYGLAYLCRSNADGMP